MEEEIKKEIPAVVLGVTLDEEAVKALMEGKETELIKGFISQRTGKAFDAFLKMSGNQLKYRFPERGELKKKASPSAAFADKKNTVPTKVGGVDLDEEDIADLKAGRETKLIMDIESKKKGKYYDAYLKWNETTGIKFRFPGMD
ncbi:MAG TPA: topoisomerase C-terminal repeat-containing protein [Cytophagaceae bacterium]|jgi:hypothetical protein|nr:topoisomerase C-terminal repeat-containing protein [Cytophagaceae bacterium]